MAFAEKVKHELHAVLDATMYFGGWLTLLITLKQLILAEYHIEFSGLAKAFTGTLVLSKVVLVLERVNFGGRVAKSPAWVEILLRTTLYATALFVVMVAEKLVHALRGDASGVAEAWLEVRRSADFDHAMATTIALTCALLVYNFLSVVRRYLPSDGLVGVLRRPVPDPEGGENSSALRDSP